MIRMVDAELLKIRTTRTFMGLTIGAIAFALLQLLALIFVGGGAFGLATPRAFAGMGQNAYIFAGVLGVLVITGEARHSTSDHTFLVAPNRTRVVLTKAAAGFVAAVVMGIIVELAVFAVGLPLLAARGTSYSFGIGTFNAIAWQLLGVGLVAVFGMAVGGVVRHQVAGIIIVAAWLTIGEVMLFALLPDLSRYGVGAAVDSLTAGGPLRLWAGALLLAYILVLGGAGTALLERRDLT